MATSVGEATIKLSFDDKSLKASTDKAEKDIKGTFERIGSYARIGGKLITAGILAASTAITGLAGKSIEMYGEYEQLVGGVETLFKDSADELMEYASQSYKTAQINANDYMSLATSFSASLIQSLGGDTKKAAKIADQAIIDMSDNANKMGTSMESIQNAYQGFAKQNFTMLDNLKLGYGGTKGEMERLLKDAEKLSGIKYDISSFADMTEAIHVIQTEMGITGTSAMEAGTTIQGSMNMAKASIQDLITGLTNPDADLGQLIDNVVTSIVGDGSDTNKGMLGNLRPAINSALKGIGELIKKGLPQIIEIANGILVDVFPDLLMGAVELFGTIVDYLPQLVQTLITLFQQLVIQLLPQLPVIIMGIVNAIIESIKTLSSPQNLGIMLAAALDLFMTLVYAIPQIIVALVEALPDIISNIIAFLVDPNTILMLIDASVELFMALVKAVPLIMDALFKAFGQLIRQLWEKLTILFSDFAGKFGEKISSVFKKAVNSVLAWIEGIINGPIDIINGFITTINEAFGPLGVNLSHIQRIALPRLAEGGIATSATTAIIGEAGREAVIPLERNTDNWAGLLASTLAKQFEHDELSLGNGVTVYMTNNINNNLDADEIGQRLMTSIRRAA